METRTLDRSLIESEFESFVSRSKSYITTRDEVELKSLREEINLLGDNLKVALRDSQNNHDANYKTAVKLMLSIIDRFSDSVDLMENLKSVKPLLEEFDTKKMLDVILPNIKCLTEYDSWSKTLDTKKLEEDCIYIAHLEDQHKRILLTYLIQDWKNIDEVLNLLKIGELYKNIAEKLVSLSLLHDYIEEN